MFIYSEPSRQSWDLSQGKNYISIDRDVAINLKQPDFIALNFLLQNFNNKFQGSILNEEEGFTTQLQVSVFLNAIFKQSLNLKKNFLVLIITPEYLLTKWKNKLEKFGAFKTITVDSKTRPADFDQKNSLALLLSFENIKMAEVLSEYRLASVVIDHFDIVATKLVIKRVYGEFNIGITRRNFYTEPDQKLLWTMLNWANPNSVGRLVDYYESDNDNFANLRDNYHHWWLTLTWDYCENFKRHLDDEEDESPPQQYIKPPKRKYKRKTQESSKSKIDSSISSFENEGNVNRVNEAKISDKETMSTNNDHRGVHESESNKNVRKTEEGQKVPKVDVNVSDSDTSSQDTIEYDVEDLPITEVSKTKYHDDVLMGIIEGNSSENAEKELDHESQVHLKKEELYSQIIDDVPIPDTHNQTSDSESFLLSLI